MAFIDPLNDPRFPNRPSHPHFWKITEIINYQDGEATEADRSAPDIVGEIADPDSVAYVAQMRARRLVQSMHRNSASGARLEMMLAAMWLDAFTTGVRFGQSVGGSVHKDQDGANDDHQGE